MKTIVETISLFGMAVNVIRGTREADKGNYDKASYYMATAVLGLTVFYNFK